MLEKDQAKLFFSADIGVRTKIMNDTYKTPQSNLHNIDDIPTPKEAYICCFLLFLELIASLSSNFMFSYGEPGLSPESPEGLFVIAFTMAILAYFIYLTLNRKKAIQQWVHIFIIIGLIFNIYAFMEQDFILSMGDITSIVSILLLIFVAVIFRNKQMLTWLVE